MANVTFTTYNENKLATAFIGALKPKMIPLNACTTKIDVAGKTKGDAITVGKYTGGTAATRTLGSAGTGSGTVVGVPLTLTDPIYVQWGIPKGVGGAAEFERVGIEQMAVLASAALAVPFAAVTAANFGNTAADKYIKSAADFGVSSVADIGTLASTKKLHNAAMVLNGSYYWRLISSFSAGLLDKDSLQSGVLPRMGGMPTYEYPDLPSNSENLVGLAADPTSLLVGLAPVTPSAASGEGDLIASEIITDETGSIAMTYERWYKSDEGTMFGRCELWVVAAVGNNGIIRIVSK